MLFWVLANELYLVILNEGRRKEVAPDFTLSVLVLLIMFSRSLILLIASLMRNLRTRTQFFLFVPLLESAEKGTRFVEDGVRELLKARRVLCGSYVYGYYLEDNGYNKTIFEFMQVIMHVSSVLFQIKLGMFSFMA
jgi:hypothetical protein